MREFMQILRRELVIQLKICQTHSVKNLIFDLFHDFTML